MIKKKKEKGTGTRINVDPAREGCRVEGQRDLAVDVCSSESLEQPLVGLLLRDRRQRRFGSAHFSRGGCGLPLLGGILTGACSKTKQNKTFQQTDSW